MESKRLILAITLSIVIFLGWNYLSRQMGWLPDVPEPVPQEAMRQNASTPAAGQRGAGDPGVAIHSPPVMPPQAPVSRVEEDRLVTVETPLYKAVFSTRGGILRQFFLKGYHTVLDANAPLVNMVSEKAATEAPMGILLDGVATWSSFDWTFDKAAREKGMPDDPSTGESTFVLGAGEQCVLRFLAEREGTHITRELVFSGDAYTIDETVGLRSNSRKSVNVAFTFGANALAVDERPSFLSRLRHAVFGGEPPVASESQYNPTRVAWYQNSSFDETSSVKDLTEGKLVQGQVSWMAVMNNYFMGAVSMNDQSASAKGRRVDDVFHVLIGKTGITANQESETFVSCTYFIGPKESVYLEAAPNNLKTALDYGFFSVVAKPLVLLLRFLYSYVHNYGIAIILMTVLIKILFWPLSQKSYKSMQQMRQVQPLVTRIREKYADDKEAMNREIMQLYKTYKINPAGGCLPILVQLPVFFGLYQALLNAIELRHAPFVTTLPFTDLPWLADLASPDPFCITPLVMGATMLLQQKMTPTPGDPTQAKIMMFMPLIFTVLFINFPSGLVVYWLVNNVISIGQQWWQLRRAV